MDLIKKLTGKNPAEYESVAKSLVDNADIDLFAKLVKQDDFLFDFVKNNVSKRIQRACNKENYLNLLKFFDYYSPSYDTMFAEVLYEFGGKELIPVMKEIFIEENDSKKAYAAKFFSFTPKNLIQDLLPLFRQAAHSKYSPLSVNAIEVLSQMGDEVSKDEALEKLKSNDEFEQYEGVKFLVNYQAKDTIGAIIDVMKKSTLSENIASEIPYLIPIDELLSMDFDAGVLVLCNIVNAIPEIIPPSAAIDYNLFEVFESLYIDNFSSSASVLLRIAKDKFAQLLENDEYLFDCDKNTKDEIYAINNLLKGMNPNKLDSLLYEELYDGSDFVFFAVDYVDELGELEALLDSSNQTLLLKVLTLLKEKSLLKQSHKDTALKNIESNEIRQVIEVL